MPRYWVIAPVESKPPELYEGVWRADLAESLISIGWCQLGDISKASRAELSAAVAKTFPAKPPSARSLVANMLWNFFHEIQPGDVILARRGRKVLAGVGTVTGPAHYSEAKHSAMPGEHSHRSFLNVAWDAQPRDKAFPTIVFPMHTLSEIAEAEAQDLLGEPKPIGLVPPASDPPVDQYTFVLEKYLEDFIVSNFDAIFKGGLRIHIDSDGNEGQQYNTDAGNIDILAFEAATDSFVVLELKKGRSSDQVVGQILRYMGWVKTNLCLPNQDVKGLIICRDPDIKLTYALKMTPAVGVRYYNVSFKLRESP